MQAFATAWAGAISCGPDCYVNVDSAASAIGEVTATAATSAYSAVCAGAPPVSIRCSQRPVFHGIKSLLPAHYIASQSEYDNM